jgi:uncharacterized membrane protein YqhA
MDEPDSNPRHSIAQRAFGRTRYIALIAIAGSFLAAFALLIYEAIVIIAMVGGVIREGVLVQAAVKTLAIGLIEAIDVFLIAIVLYVISLGLYSLFVDNSLALPRWLVINDLDDLKKNLVSLVIAVLAVLFLREAVAWDGSRDIFGFGAALALVIAALTFYLTKKGGRKD